MLGSGLPPFDKTTPHARPLYIRHIWQTWASVASRKVKLSRFQHRNSRNAFINMSLPDERRRVSPDPGIETKIWIFGGWRAEWGKEYFSHVYNTLITSALQHISKGINFSVNRILKGEEGEWKKEKQIEYEIFFRQIYYKISNIKVRNFIFPLQKRRNKKQWNSYEEKSQRTIHMRI